MGKIVALINNPSSTSVYLSPGTYKFECWGAQGGIGLRQGVKYYPGGRGAYTSGVLKIEEDTTFYLFVGGRGKDGNSTKNTIAKGGFNGGGNGGPDTDDDEGSGSGGGSSDIRLIGGLWNNFTSIFSRIMVAAGGSGSAYEGYGAPGGALNGYNTSKINSESFTYSSTSQTNGYLLGIGENGRPHGWTPSSGAGGGYYGGLAVDGVDQPTNKAVSSSGTSFISGYPGCNAVDIDGNHTDSPIHYSQIVFSNPIMKSGLETFFSPYNKRERGHEGDGAIRITRVGESFLPMTCRCRNTNRTFSFLAMILVIYSK